MEEEIKQLRFEGVEFCKGFHPAKYNDFLENEVLKLRNRIQYMDACFAVAKEHLEDVIVNIPKPVK